MLQGAIIRGTTPEHEFDLPYPVEMVQDIHVTYGQKGKPVFTKTIKDCTITEGKIAVSLTQEDTFLFIPNKNLCVEVRIKLSNGKVVRTEDPIVLRVIDTMDEEVMN